MSLLSRIVVAWLSFSLASFIAAIPTETTSSAPTATLAPRQTNILGWYSTDSTYSPYMCQGIATYCQTSTYAGCVNGSPCTPPITCISSSSYIQWKGGGTYGTTGCGPSPYQCYMVTMHPAPTDPTGIVSTFAQCDTAQPSILFRESPRATASSTSEPSISATSPTPTVASNQTSPASAHNTGSGLSKGAQAGIGVGATAGGTTIIVIIVLYWKNKKFRDQVNNIVNNIIGNHNKVDQGINGVK
ncbi:hypothetical protein TGAM01_v202957 [Trichoderma gamsii]|uniref:Uncharacterized protein n=1 Tax=Trichoderma gamsii TaxID=398673 RepID=A0A2P4ZVZ9_9HYPO|nr:hypothetical protein TGAM01_v202957 [Trichoderma gamsii]PON28463.1 hypothetical protein TGAM01_v202957 [Trichoderma gamsii]